MEAALPTAEVRVDGTRTEMWVIQVMLSGRRYDLEVVVNRKTGEVEVGFTHKPI